MSIKIEPFFNKYFFVVIIHMLKKVKFNLSIMAIKKNVITDLKNVIA